MICTVQVEDTLNLNLRGALWRKPPTHVLYGKPRFRVAVAFENLVMHVIVAIFVARITAFDIDHDCATRCACRSVELDIAALELERSVYGVHRRAQRKVDLRGCGLQLQRRLLRLTSRSTR